MMHPPEARNLAPEAPLKFIGGDLSADLVNTVDWGPELTDDRLSDYERVLEWSEAAGVLPPGSALRLRKRARGRPEAAEEALAFVRSVRWILRRVLGAAATGVDPGGALEEFNSCLREALAHLEVGSAGVRGPRWPAEWNWRGMDDDLRSPMWPVLWAAARLLTSDEAPRIRVCAGEACGWIYVDRSRNRLRRWCQMSTCGTREKSRRRSQRARTEAER